MKAKEKGKMVSWSTVFILVMLITVTFLALYAWAKYKTSKSGQSGGQVAKWHFSVSADGKQINSGKIEFADTRTDDNKDSIKQGTIAPGTKGEFEIVIDTTGTEVLMVYEIKIDLEDCPNNLRFYADSAKTREIGKTKISEKVVDNKTIPIYELNIAKFLSLNEADENYVNKIHEETIYWDWPFETGTNALEIAQNNRDDSKWINKDSILMEISAVGTQVSESPFLVDRVKVGDFVNYKSSSGNATFTSEKCPNGISISDEFSTIDFKNKEDNNEKTWRVLSIDKTTQTVELMLVEPTNQTVTMGEYGMHEITQRQGISAYMNAIKVLDQIGDVYGHGAGAVGGRSINVNDIMQYSSINPELDYKETYDFGKTRTYEEGRFILGELYEGEELVQGGIDNRDGTVNAQEDNPVTVKGTYYQQGNFKSTFVQKDSENGTTKYNMIFKKMVNSENYKNEYWLASRCTFISSSFCGFGLRFVLNGNVYVVQMFQSHGNANKSIKAVIPVVELKSGIKTSGVDDNRNMAT